MHWNTEAIGSVKLDTPSTSEMNVSPAVSVVARQLPSGWEKNSP